MRATRVVSQSVHDKMLQLRPWCFCVVLATEKTYTVHIKYRKLNLLGCDGVDKEAQTGFFKPQSKSLFVCHKVYDMFTRKYLPRVSGYSTALL